MATAPHPAALPAPALPIPAWLEAPLITLAWCWRIERRDGATLGLTTHDADLLRDGLLYRAAPGMRPSAIRLDDSLEGESMELAGALSHAALSEAELLAGRYDGATLSLLLADWEDAATPLVPVAAGRLTAVRIRDGGFTAEMRLRPPALDTPVSRLTTPTCRAHLGDGACRVDMAPRIQRTRITAIAEDRVTIDAPILPDAYAHGLLRWLDGPLAGLRTSIVDQIGQQLWLADPPGVLPALPARVELHQGCDKRIATCRSRFANARNFQGEPWLPGMDLLTRYPGG